MAHPFDSLNSEEYISLTTFRKNGDGVPTPVWFVRDGDKLYVYTQAHSGKVKRIRNNGQVTVAACDVRGNVHGEPIAAQARVLTPAESTHLERLFDAKYKLMKSFFGCFGTISRLLGRKEGERVYLELTAA